MSDTPPGATFPIPPPSWRLPWGDMRNGQVYLNNNAINFLQLVWAAIQGAGGITDLILLNLNSVGVNAGAMSGLIADQARSAAVGLQRPVVREISPSSVLWIPQLAGTATPGVQTYAAQVGALAYVGPLVVALFSITLSAFDATTAGNLEVLGLPIDAATSDDVQAGWVGSFGGLTTPAGSQLGLELAAGSSAISLMASVSAAPTAPLAAAALSATSQIAGGVAFFR